MKREEFRWYKTEQDLRIVFKNEDYDTLLEYVDENSDSILMQIGGKNIVDAYGMLKYGISLQEKFEHSVILDNRILKTIYKMGELSGIAKAGSRICSEKRQMELVASEMSPLHSMIKHLDRIIEILGEEQFVSHDSLYRKLGMKSSSTLTECMKKVLDTQLVVCSRAGRYKVYSLSENGRRYKRILENQIEKKIKSQIDRENENNEKSIEELIDKYLYSKESLLKYFENRINKMDIQDEQWLKEKMKKILNKEKLSYERSPIFENNSVYAENSWPVVDIRDFIYEELFEKYLSDLSLGRKQLSIGLKNETERLSKEEQNEQNGRNKYFCAEPYKDYTRELQAYV